MSNREIYRKTKCFAWPRVPFSIIGAFAIIWFPILAGRLIGGYSGPLSGLVIAAATALGLCLANYISTYGTKLDRIGQIAMMARGVVYGKLPENIKEEGHRVARYHFDYVYTGEISKRALGRVYSDILKKDTAWKYAQDSGKSFMEELRSFIELFLMDKVPFVGECALGWEFAYPGETVEESIFDSMEVLFYNWGRMMLTVVLNILILVAEIFLAALAACVALIILFDASPWIENAAQFISSNAENLKDMEGMSDISLAFPIFILIGALFPFIRSRVRLRVLRKFFECADINPPDGKLYEKHKKLKKEK